MKIFAIAALVLLAGCARHQPIANQQPQPVYRQAYNAGCSSGESAAGNPWKRFTKDVNAYGANPMYVQGWEDGFRVCKGQYEAISRALR